MLKKDVDSTLKLHISYHLHNYTILQLKYLLFVVKNTVISYIKLYIIYGIGTKRVLWLLCICRLCHCSCIDILLMHTHCKTHSPADTQDRAPPHPLLFDQCILCRKCGDTGVFGDRCVIKKSNNITWWITSKTKVFIIFNILTAGKVHSMIQRINRKL